MENSSKPMRVAIALSGGVDSLVAAIRLLQGGYDVFGVFMRLWRPSQQDHLNDDELEKVKYIAQKLNISLDVVDYQASFKDVVVKGYLNALTAGLTPNPCILCNRTIKWGLLLDYVRSKGADYLASGHYARLKPNANGSVSLYKGLDENKDQSYVLSVLPQSVLRQIKLPVGELTKSYVKQIASENGFKSTNENRESQDLCFLEGLGQDTFIQQYLEKNLIPGDIIDNFGKIIGTHKGLPLYTIGQRKGLGIASPLPYYVVEKNIDDNVLFVTHSEGLLKFGLLAKDANWIADQTPDPAKQYHAKIRYRAKPLLAKVQMLTKFDFKVQFNEGLRDITPGQRIVLYDEECCLGGGEIVKAL